MAGHILCSPGSSGLSFALARQLLQHTKQPLFATARKDLGATKQRLLEGLDVDASRITMLQVDYKDEATVSEAASQMKQQLGKEGYLRLALFTPGVLINPEKTPKQINYDDSLETFKVNTLGPMLAIKHFSDLLPKRGAKLTQEDGLPSDLAVFAIMTARVGSIADNKLGGWFAYRASKAASNQLSKTLQNNLQMTKRPAISVTLHPGTVKTHLSREFWASTKEEKLFSPEFSACKLHEVIQTLTTESGGRQFDWKGEQIPY
ncbi:short-chain dehydrogenase/reductase-like protein [Protomyces lactucae-debilis]|uniref:Short-chain dehydrogenase/reductase-like protein n=1 Tax=Protomyces lactucae-debilis TaxID=2754530 RepID=A0A1Y2FBW1_PROLT|nr:short-chain dehydrogenase/reductase-like protein [Protomyces lactucae-debilis]ORY81393.1 short-chain dehydrogenase/reductase-like protein [Protomyces lactucae-debilis]